MGSLGCSTMLVSPIYVGGGSMGLDLSHVKLNGYR